MGWIDFSRWDLEAMAAAWAAARPFPHVVIDGLLPADRLMELRVAVSREPHSGSVDHFYEILGSSLPMAHPLLREFEASLGAPEALAVIAAVTGKPVTRVEMRSYVYLAGHFLLPHSDFRPDLDRQVAYAYYLVPRETSAGGELELFECDLDGLEVLATREAGRIEPLENRLVIFDVSPASLHQVREVTWGGRVSLSGWFSGEGQEQR